MALKPPFTTAFAFACGALLELQRQVLKSLGGLTAQALTLFKAQSLIQQLRTLGFADWQCVPAIMRHGSDLEEAVAFLLEGGVQTAEQAQELLNAATELPQIDLAPELARIHHIRVCPPPPPPPIPALTVTQRQLS